MGLAGDVMGEWTARVDFGKGKEKEMKKENNIIKIGYKLTISESLRKILKNRKYYF